MDKSWDLKKYDILSTWDTNVKRSMKIYDHMTHMVNYFFLIPRPIPCPGTAT